VKNALAIEFMTAAAAIDQRAPLKASLGARTALAVVREKVPPMTGDRPLYEDIANVALMLETGAITNRVTKALGALA